MAFSDLQSTAAGGATSVSVCTDDSSFRVFSPNGSFAVVVDPQMNVCDPDDTAGLAHELGFMLATALGVPFDSDFHGDRSVESPQMGLQFVEDGSDADCARCGQSLPGDGCPCIVEAIGEDEGPDGWTIVDTTPETGITVEEHASPSSADYAAFASFMAPLVTSS